MIDRTQFISVSLRGRLKVAFIDNPLRFVGLFSCFDQKLLFFFLDKKNVTSVTKYMFS